MNEVGRVAELVRYPVKSMAGTATESAFLGWHGLAGDRRFAFRRLGDDSDFPWLNATRAADLLLYRPTGLDERTGEPLPTHVHTPAGRQVELRSAELQREVAERSGGSVELMHLRNGVFDDAPVSLISLTTIAGIGEEARMDVDRRCFRANIVLETGGGPPFLEDGWVGGTLLFGTSEPRPAVRVIARDVRCMMVNLDPDTARQDARVLKTIVRMNNNNAGVYGTVVQTGTIRVGDSVSVVRDAVR